MDSTPYERRAEAKSAAAVDTDASRAAADADQPVSTMDDQEGLPAYEPLTPELVEDEAVRGDFMLRWSAVLLAVLLGWTEVSETATLVRIRTGEYLAAHGWLPPATDVFSSTAGEQRWLNFSWLSDLVLAGIYAVGGAVALTIVTAILAGVSFWCVTAAARSSVSTWWGSICAVLAAVAAFPLLRAGPDSITILGLSATMLLLMKWEERPERARYWLLLPLFWLWSNLDSHAFVGAAALAAYALGDAIDSRRSSAGAARGVWMFALGAVAVMFVHPFHVSVARAPLLQYAVEYPEQLRYAGDSQELRFLWLRVIDRAFWEEVNVFSLSGVLVAAAALVSMALNRKRVRFSHVATWLAVNAMALWAAHQLAAVAVVNAVLATVNGQEWYRANFRQSYSVELTELIFSRGGRALTVLGMFALAYLGISGRLMGADGRRIGMGLAPALESSIASFREVLNDSFDDRPFNFVPSQGDVIIWLGQKPFIDSRLAMYGSARPSLTDLHRKVRLALRQRVVGDERTGQRGVWHSVFEKHGITHVLPRLTGRQPDYLTFFDLMTDPEREWRLVKLEAATAALYWSQPDNPQLAEYLAKHPGADFIRLAFPKEAEAEDAGREEAPPLVIAPPREPTWYDQLLILPRNDISNSIQLARHYGQIRTALAGRVSADYLAALSMLTIRHAREGLAEDPNSGLAYQAMAAAYLTLFDLERLFDQRGTGVSSQLRVRQVLGALHHAVTCDPDDATAHLSLYQMLLSTGKLDLALHHLQEVQRITGGRLTLLPADAEGASQEQERNSEVLNQLSSQVETIRNELRQALQSDSPRLEVVQSALTRGMPGEALRLLEEDRTLAAQNASVQLLMSELLLDAGRSEEALTQLESLSGVMLPQNPGIVSGWRHLTAMTNIVTGNYERACELLAEDAKAATETRLQTVLGTSPLPGESPGLSTTPLTHAPVEILDMRPMTRATIAFDLLVNYPLQWGRDQFTRAACLVEEGRNAAAVELFQDILRLDPESEMRATSAFYISTITGEPQEFVPPSQQIPVWGGMFAEDTEAPEERDQALPSQDSQPEGAAAESDELPPAPPTSERRADAADSP